MIRSHYLKELTLIFAILILHLFSFAQTLSVIDDNCFGGSGDDVSEGFLIFPNGNTLIYGSSNSPISGTKSESCYGMKDGWVVMLDQNNTELWQKTIGGTFDDYFYSAIILSNGDVLLCGTSNSGISGNKTSSNFGLGDVWIVKITSSGNIVYDKTFGGTDTDSGGSIIEYSSNRIALIASSGSGMNGNKTSPNKGQTDCWLLKIDGDGNCISQASIGGSNFDSYSSHLIYSNNRIDIALNSMSDISGDKNENSYGIDDIWMLSIDTNFTILNQKTIGGDNTDLGTTILKFSNGNTVIIAMSDSGISGLKSEGSNGALDTWLIELAPNFDLIREKTIGSDQDEFTSSSMLLPNNELVVLCSSSSDINDFKTQNNIGMRDIWVYKLNNAWEFVFDKTIGSTGNEAAKTMIAESSTSFSVISTSSGSNNNDKTCAGYGSNDFWLVDFNSTLNTNDLSVELLKVYPNPTNDFVTVNTSGFENYTFSLTDLRGNTLYQTNIPNNSKTIELDVSKFATGNYILVLKDQFHSQFLKIQKN